MKTYFIVTKMKVPLDNLSIDDLHDTIEQAQEELKQYQQGKWKIFKVTVEECPS